MKQRASLISYVAGTLFLSMCVPSCWAEIRRASNGHFYEIVAAPGITWDDANTGAVSRILCGKPGHLATSTSASENSFLNTFREDFIDENGGEVQFWIGGYQIDKSDEPGGNWTWVNGEGAIPGDNGGPGYANWAPGEPNDTWGSEEHLTIGRFDDDTWNDQGGVFDSMGGYIVEYDADATVVIDGCDTGVPNAVVNDEFCTISDLIAQCAANATTHGGFVSCVAATANSLKKQGLITGKQQGKIVSCAAKANIP